MTVLTTFTNGGSNKDFRDTFNSILARLNAIEAGGTPTPSPTPTPGPAFTTQPSISDDGTPQVGETLTGNDGVIANGTVSGRAWLLNGTAISGATGSTYVPTQTGTHAYRVTATGAGGTTQATSAGKTVAAATPTPTGIEKIVIEGDSITYAGGAGFGGFADQYRLAPPSGKTVTVDAENSRTVGGAAYGGDLEDTGTPAGNTMLAHRADDLATGAGAIGGMIGTNDFAAFAPATYQQRLIDWATPIRAAGVKTFWSLPYPLCTNQAYPGYADWMTRWTAMKALARNPAVWGQWADVYVPMGDEPNFNAADNTALINNTDGVHPSLAGHAALYPVLKAALDTLFDSARATSNQMYSSAWPASETNLATSTQITRSFIVKGINPAGLALGAAVTGGGAQIRLNGGAWASAVGKTSGNGFRIYNGDTIDLRLTTSASNATDTSVDLTVGSETRTLTYRTVASVTPVAYSHGDVQGQQFAGPKHTYAALNFAASGLALIGVNWGADAVTGVKVGGVAATRLKQQSGGYGAVVLEVWAVAVTAGARDVEVTASAISAGTTSSSAISWGVLTGADPTPTANVSDNAADSTNLSTGSITVPASGLAVGFFGEYAGGASVTPAVVNAGNAGTTAIDEGQIGYNGETKGLAVAGRSVTGAFVWDFAGGGYSPHPRAAIAFKAAGT